MPSEALATIHCSSHHVAVAANVTYEIASKENRRPKKHTDIGRGLLRRAAEKMSSSWKDTTGGRPEAQTVQTTVWGAARLNGKRTTGG
mmetsp:Transcript_35424/g.69918  ORF Transcript_35424/g.69918 Transcript_35424/m.69918 type:complete len:88 (-) Transcript_35424:1084-1347(-)